MVPFHLWDLNQIKPSPLLFFYTLNKENERKLSEVFLLKKLSIIYNFVPIRFQINEFELNITN
jgi:hypothetical protein